MEPFQVDVNVHLTGDLPSCDHFFLHVVTHTDRADYRANGAGFIATALNDDDELEVELLINQDPNFPNEQFNTPVLHTLQLPSAAFVNVCNEVNVKVTVNVENSLTGKRKVGEASTQGASGQDSRPIPGRV